MNLAQSATKENLMKAFAGESQARNRYTFAASVAKKQNMYIIQQIFDFTAHQEKEHAQIFYDFLKEMNGGSVNINTGYPVGNYEDLAKLLRDAQHHEYQESSVIYPEFARVARDEGFAAIADAFEKIAQIENSHGNRFGAFGELIEQNRIFKADGEIYWICLNCGHIHKGKEAPVQCPVCHHAQGYFVPEKYYKFLASDYTK